jgi:hypothetical protein
LLAPLLYQASYTSNTSGVFKAFHRGWGGQTGTALYRILSELELKPALFCDNGRENEVYQLDCQHLVQYLASEGMTVDVAYLDPPYNQHPYGSNYHVLNSLSLWDKPAVTPKIEGRNKSAIRDDWRTERRSAYNYRGEAWNAYAKMLETLDARFILTSYSTDGMIPLEGMVSACIGKGTYRSLLPPLQTLSREFATFFGQAGERLNLCCWWIAGGVIVAVAWMPCVTASVMPRPAPCRFILKPALSWWGKATQVSGAKKTMNPLRQRPVFGIVAGEVSGDTLGAGLIRALRQRYPDARFVGICGPQMQDAGGESWFPMERLSVMGLVEVLGRIRELFAIRDELQRRFLDERIDCFIGIDAPDFNLRLAPALKAAGIPTVHYVSPSVWAWRQGRIHKIKASVDLMLCLLPFEKAFYDRHALKAVFVGHPLADSLPIEHDARLARQQLGLTQDARVIALLPGSRGGEVGRIAPVLFEAAKKLAIDFPDAVFVIPAINSYRREQISELLTASGLKARIADERLWRRRGGDWSWERRTWSSWLRGQRLWRPCCSSGRWSFCTSCTG